MRRPRSVACCFSTLSQRLILPLFLSGHFSVFVLFCCHDFFLSRAEHPPPDLSVLKGSGQSPASGPEYHSIFSGRPGRFPHKVKVNLRKNLHPLNGPCGSRDYGSYFFAKPCFPISPQVFEYGKVRRWLLRTPISKRGMATKKAQYRKLPLSRAKRGTPLSAPGFFAPFFPPPLRKKGGQPFPRKRYC